MALSVIDEPRPYKSTHGYGMPCSYVINYMLFGMVHFVFELRQHFMATVEKSP